MKQVVLRVKNSRYAALLEMLSSLDYVHIIATEEKAKQTKPNYDFSDIAGKLQWKGDAVQTQRALRDEW
jgi:hypothetical protein